MYKTIKFPLRWLFQILNISLFICLIVLLFTKNIDVESPYSILLGVSLILEVFSIVYVIRNKTYCYIGKDETKYLIKKKNLTSDEERKTSEGVIVDHYCRFGSKEIDVLNLIDLLMSAPSNKEIQKQIENKVLTYPKYQVKNIKLNFKLLGMYSYLIEFENGKKRRLFIFNAL